MGLPDFKPVTDSKIERKVYRIVDAAAGTPEPFNLLDPSGLCIRTGHNTQDLADYALESGLADDVRHDEDLVKAHAVKHLGAPTLRDRGLDK